MITAKEAEIYDRQIRLWGVEGQLAMRSSRILVVGLAGCSAEVVKNIVLAGVGRVDLMDGAVMKQRDLGSQFFLREDDVGKNRAIASLERVRELNPHVRVEAFPEGIETKRDDGFFQQYNAVVLTECSITEQLRVDAICRRVGVLLIAMDCFGLLGVAFCDYGPKYDYTVKKAGKGTVPGTCSSMSLAEVYSPEMFASGKWARMSLAWLAAQSVMKYMTEVSRGGLPEADKAGFFGYVKNTFTPLVGGREDAIAAADAARAGSSSAFAKRMMKRRGAPFSGFDDAYLQKVGTGAGKYFSPVCAIMGGVIGNALLRGLCRDTRPIENFFVYDGLTSFAGTLEKLE